MLGVRSEKLVVRVPGVVVTVRHDLVHDAEGEEAQQPGGKTGERNVCACSEEKKCTVLVWRFTILTTLPRYNQLNDVQNKRARSF